MRGKSYAEIAIRVTAPFLDGMIAPARWERMVADAYADFDDPESRRSSPWVTGCGCSS